MLMRIFAALLLLAGLFMKADAQEPARPRIRELGVSPGILSPGPLNGITDVPGVRVGHTTVYEEGARCTGVTAILPHGDNVFDEKVPAGVAVANAFGKAAGLLQVRELGTLETPIVLTNTLNVGTAVEAVVAWTLAQPGNEAVRSVNAVVGETNDGYLNDIRGQHVTGAHVVSAIESAAEGPVEEGSVGAGTGTLCLGWKGGIGTSSRVLPPTLGGYTVGVLVQTNFGGILTIDGVRVGEALGRYDFREALRDPQQARAGAFDGDHEALFGGAETGSVMIVVATNAPLSPRNLERLANRAPLGLARTGSFISNGSGDFVIAFSTENRVPQSGPRAPRMISDLPNDAMSPLFLAVVEAVEEAVYNSLTKAQSRIGVEGRTVPAIPIVELRRLFGAR